MTKTSKIELRLTDDEKEQVRKAAEIQGLSISDYIRQVILNQSPLEIGINKGLISEQAYMDFVTLQAEGRAKTSSTGVPEFRVPDFKKFLKTRYAHLADEELDKGYAAIFNDET